MTSHPTATHTPGPWGVIHNATSQTVYSTAKNELGFYLDADVNGANGASVADAVLMAAAPDLLSALQYLVKVPSRLSGEQLATAQLAIAKATGDPK